MIGVAVAEHKRNDMHIMRSQEAEPVLRPCELCVLAVLREVGRVYLSKSSPEGVDAGSDSDMSGQPGAGRYFEGREAVELSILMGWF